MTRPSPRRASSATGRGVGQGRAAARYGAEQGAGGDGPQRTFGRRGFVPCGPRLSLGVRRLCGALECDL